VIAKGQRPADEQRAWLVTISCLHAAADTRAARLYKDLGRPTPSAAVLDELAARLAITAGRRRHEISLARDAARAAMSAASRAGIGLVTCLDAGYPPLLQEIADPPVVLWTRGDGRTLRAPAVAIVGARAATPAGVAIARRLGHDLASAGLVIVSGLARGVDGAAHAGALAAGGQSVAVLGSGVDVVYPAQHEELAAGLTARGAIVSELPPGSPPLAHHFPLRNRIISGLVRAVVVIEASDRSGSLITAKAALEQGRDVLAVPGNVASGRYRGCHGLIKDGARLVETVEDVLEELGWTPAARGRHAGDDGQSNSLQESELEQTMAPGESYTLDELAAATGRPVPGLLAELAHLELAGRVSRLPGGSFVKA
jgi:DNA processing protein